MKSFIVGLFILFFALLGPSRHAGAAALSDGDRKLYQAAFAAAERGDMRAAWVQADKAQDQLPAQALKWLSLTRGGSGASFFDITQFMTDHPDWPSQTMLEERAEEAMSGVGDADITAWFANHPPVSFNGKLRAAELMIAAGNADQGQARIREIWIGGNLNPFDEKSMLQRFRGVLRPVDDEQRLSRLLWDGQTAAAKRMLPLVASGPRAVAETRMALEALKSNASQMAAKLPPNLRNDTGLLFDLVRWSRRKNHGQRRHRAARFRAVRSRPRDRNGRSNGNTWRAARWPTTSPTWRCAWPNITKPPPDRPSPNSNSFRAGSRCALSTSPRSPTTISSGSTTR